MEKVARANAECKAPGDVVAGARGLVPKDTIVTRPNHWGIPDEEWARRDAALREWRWSRSERHRAEAHRAEKARDRTRARWHESRADSLMSPFVARRDRCGKERVARAWCPACGAAHDHPVRCGQRLWCPVCSRVWSARLRRRASVGLGEALRAARASWARAGRPRGKEPRPVLITLTVRPSPDARDVITRGWGRMRAWLAKRGIRPPYVAVWEATGGDGSVPHVHLHVVGILPFVAVGEMADEWVRATEGAAEAQGCDLRQCGLAGAVRYVAAYAAKGIDPRMPTDAWCAVVRAWSGRRGYSASRGVLAARRAPCACGYHGPRSVVINEGGGNGGQGEGNEREGEEVPRGVVRVAAEGGGARQPVPIGLGP